jgi:hypothetical protein
MDNSRTTRFKRARSFQVIENTMKVLMCNRICNYNKDIIKNCILGLGGWLVEASTESPGGRKNVMSK